MFRIGPRTFLLTFLTYALIHSIRTANNYLKPYLHREPLNFSTGFLGELDMMALVSLAVALKTMGWAGEKIGYKVFLLTGVILLVAVLACLVLVEMLQCTTRWVYLILYSLIGLVSCTGWPSCLSILSEYYPAKQNGFKLCLWNGCSPAGDFIAILLGELLISQLGLQPYWLVLSIASLLLIIMLVDIKWLPKSKGRRISSQPPPEQIVVVNPPQIEVADNVQQLVQTNSPNQIVECKVIVKAEPSVNFLNVWSLPGVAGLVIINSCFRAANAMMMHWLFFYLSYIGLHKSNGTIVLTWTLSMYVGNLLMGYFNKSSHKMALVISLMLSCCLFAVLGEYETNSSLFYYAILIPCGVLLGGPLGLTSNKLALDLADLPQTKKRKGAMGAIISLIEGFGMFIGALSVLLVPWIGIKYIFNICGTFVMLGTVLLAFNGIGKQQNDQRNIEPKATSIEDNIERPNQKQLIF